MDEYLNLEEAKKRLAKGRKVLVSWRDDDEGTWLNEWRCAPLTSIEEDSQMTVIGMEGDVGGLNYTSYLSKGNVLLIKG